MLVKCTTTSATRNKVHISPSCLSNLEATGDFFFFHSAAACLRFIQATASLVYPLPIHGRTITLRHLPFATGGHVIALWRGRVLKGGENSLSNEAAQGVASLLLRSVCVCLCRPLVQPSIHGMLLSHTHNNRFMLSEEEKKGLKKGIKQSFDGTNNNNNLTLVCLSLSR